MHSSMLYIVYLHFLSSELQGGSGRGCIRTRVHDLPRDQHPKTQGEEADAQWTSYCNKVSYGPYGELPPTIYIAFRHDQAGNFMASISTQGPVFFYSSKPSTKFEVLGYIGMY